MAKKDQLIDPRAGLTSASNAGADKLCPGRHLAQRGLIDRESDEAKAGTLGHERFANPEMDLSGLSSSEKKTLTRARDLETLLHIHWMGSVVRGAPMGADSVRQSAHREKRHWAHYRKKQIHSGQIDAYWLSPDWSHALIEDLKTMWGDVADADANEQLRDLAAILWENYGCKTVSVFINQPNVKWNVEDVVFTTYQQGELRLAHRAMIHRVMASNHIEAPRIPGPKQCAFCRAAGTSHCPESIKYIRGPVPDMRTGTPAERGEWLSFLKTREKMIEAQIDAAREVLAGDSSAIEGWTIGKPRKIRAIKQIAEVGGILREAFPATFDTDALLACCKLSVPDLESLHLSLTEAGDLKAKLAEFRNLFGHLIETIETAGPLKKIT